jgi:hypothetical protein
MLHTRVVSCLTICTHLHSQQKASASQQLPLEMEKAGGKRAWSVSPCSARESQSSGVKVLCLFVSQIFLEISQILLRNFLEIS